MSELTQPNLESYTSSYTNGFPSFSVYTVSAENWQGGRDDRPGTYNDETKFEILFSISKSGEDDKEVAAIPCDEAISKYVGDSDPTADLIRVNFGEDIDKYVCPDAPSFSVYEKNFMSFNNGDYEELNFFLKYKDDAGPYDWADQTYINKVFHYPYYDGNSYRENGGYLLWTSEKSLYSYYDASGSSPQSITQALTKQAVKVYSNILYDFSAFFWLAGTKFDVFRPGQEDKSFYLPN